MFRVRATGRISTLVTTPGTLTLALRLAAVDVFTSGAMTLNIVAQTNTPWILDAIMTVRAVGATTTANILGQGTWTSHAVIGSAAIGTGGAGTNVSGSGGAIPDYYTGYIQLGGLTYGGGNGTSANVARLN
jgi:hypothetical protein